MHALSRRVLALAILTALMAANCGSSETAASTDHPATSSAATSATDHLLGTYVRKVTGADIARTAGFRHEGPGQEAPSPGPARLVVTPSTVTFVVVGTEPLLSIDEDYSATAQGRLVINGYTHPDVGSFCGPETPQNAVYSWVLSGDKLTLEAVTDRCADRDSSLAGTWRRSG